MAGIKSESVADFIPESVADFVRNQQLNASPHTALPDQMERRLIGGVSEPGSLLRRIPEETNRIRVRRDREKIVFDP